jgi:murein L,D-transpeptidase YcbB/YkuD
MANIKESLKFVFKLEYGNNPKKALEKVQGENFLTYKGLQERDDADFAGWGKIHSALELFVGDKARAGEYLESDYTLQKTVEEYYKLRYWNAIRGDEITSQHTADEMLVAAVLYSPNPAIRMAQSVIGVKADGIFGVKTLEALNGFDTSIFDKLFDEKEIERAEMLADRNPRLAWAVKGWTNRARAV